MRHILPVLLALSLLPGVAQAGGFKTKKCTNVANNEIVKVYNAMSARVNQTVARFTWLTKKQRDELKRKWPKLKVDCEDDKARCAQRRSKGGFAHGGLGNRVNICYYNFVDNNLKLCDLAGTLWHEKGHADGMPRHKHHNSPDKYPAARNDAVYKMGDAAEAECIAHVFRGTANRLLKGKSDKPLGTSCSKDGQCKSGKCQSGECTCKKNTDCPGKKKCKKPLVGKNKCK